MNLKVHEVDLEYKRPRQPLAKQNNEETEDTNNQRKCKVDRMIGSIKGRRGSIKGREGDNGICVASVPSKFCVLLHIDL